MFKAAGWLLDTGSCRQICVLFLFQKEVQEVVWKEKSRDELLQGIVQTWVLLDLRTSSTL